MDDDEREYIFQVSTAEKEFLAAPFTEKEVRESVFPMEHNKAPGADWIPAEFYMVFWEVIKAELL